VPALHRAVALEQIHGVAVGIREDLDLDVPRGGQVFLDQHPIVAEARLRFALRGRERRGEIGGTLDDLHALAAAARRRLDEHRIADRIRLARELLRILVVAVITRGRAARRPSPSGSWPADFEPIAAIALAGGPMKTIPARAQSAAKLSFSERKP
jgi:hypothetical protein